MWNDHQRFYLVIKSMDGLLRLIYQTCNTIILVRIMILYTSPHPGRQSADQSFTFNTTIDIKGGRKEEHVMATSKNCRSSELMLLFHGSSPSTVYKIMWSQYISYHFNRVFSRFREAGLCVMFLVYRSISMDSIY
jgi:hypothetical protein